MSDVAEVSSARRRRLKRQRLRERMLKRIHIAGVRMCLVITYRDGTPNAIIEWSARSLSEFAGRVAKVFGTGNHIEWPKAADDFVRKHYGRDLSAARIAIELRRRFSRPFTKNAVISRWNRVIAKSMTPDATNKTS